MVRLLFMDMIGLAGPIMLTYLLEYLPGVISIILIGQLNVEGGDMILDATAMANMYLSITAISIGFGIATAMDTFASQAVGKTKGLDDSICNSLLRTYLLTGVLVLSLAFIPIFFLNFYSSSVLIALQQPREIAILCEKFVILMLPGVPGLYLYELMKKVLQAKHAVGVILVSAILSNIVNLVVGYYLVYHTPLSWLGAAVARTISNMCFPLFLLPEFYRLGLIENSLDSWNMTQAIKGMRDFFALGLSGMCQWCFEWWAFEVLALLSGLLPNSVEAIGANAVILNITTSTYMLYLGISVAGSVRIGNSIGAGNGEQAKIVSNLTIIFGMIFSTFVAVLLVVFRKSLPELFTKDEAIQRLATKLMIGIAIFQIVDAINACVQGVLRGSGCQTIGAKMVFVSYYIIGLPFGAMLALYLQFGVAGLWIGITVGLTMMSIVGSVIICRTDWDSLITASKARLTKFTDEKINSSDNHSYRIKDPSSYEAIISNACAA